MPALSDLLQEVDGLEKYSDTVGKAEKIIGGVTGIYGYYQSINQLGEFLGLWGGRPSEFDLLQQALESLWAAIKNCFSDLNLTLKAEFDSNTEKLLADPLSKLTSAVTTLAQHWGEPAEIDVAMLLYDTLAAMDEIKNEAYWKRTFYKEAAYDDPWTGPDVPPGLEQPNGGLPPPGSTYWDYLLALPTFLEGLACRVTVLKMLDAEDIPTRYRKELLIYADMLHDTYLEIVTGIRTLRKPTFDEVMYEATQIALTDFYRLNLSRWLISSWNWPGTHGWIGGLHGAYEVRSTICSVEPYPTFPPLPVSQPNELLAEWQASKEELTELRTAVEDWYNEEIERLHRLRSLIQWKRVYRSLPLRTLWQIRNELLMLVGEPPEALPRPNGLWSLREVVDAIPAELRPIYSLRAITDFCKTDNSLKALQELLL